ncbi:hypothetical protein GIB67_030814 [Kingdonia uniflora]|uniref:Uncharacterized protein n=1 Tax=Kingdonia uniflora TaxID=39325 RepID=A0A7J7L337_9MAGN|nr:hypothetical protein GIB67_030814 [Kingdonia uniflora]
MDQRIKELIEAQVLGATGDTAMLQGSLIAKELFDMEIPKGCYQQVLDICFSKYNVSRSIKCGHLVGDYCNVPRDATYGDPECIIVMEVEFFKQIGLQIDPD